MAVRLTLGQCGVAPLVRGQDGTAPQRVHPMLLTATLAVLPWLGGTAQSQDSDAEYVRLVFGRKDLYGYTVYRAPNKEIDLQDIKPTLDNMWRLHQAIKTYTPKGKM
ncbi:hypothetical protein RRG08_006103 [Elysia crispata]|uniref:Uncharacterized protein n=1 Tax=Elysia crispata TaxID=231223 RepID=A0AAE0Y957_9GAST|nr:hypothetical protein RRG08_006103 [Elysia crispata]